MANDLLILRCKGCGEGTRLFKYYPSASGCYDVTGFIQDHLGTCHTVEKISGAYFATDLGDDCPFEMHTEGSWSKKFGKVDFWIKRRTEVWDEGGSKD